MSFGSNLIALRESRGISRKELAAKLCIPYTTLRNYETDQREPGLEILRMIADIFNVSINDLLDMQGLSGSYYLSSAVRENIENRTILDYIEIESRNEAAVIFAYRNAAPADREIIDNIAKRYLPAERKKKGKNYARSLDPAVSVGDHAKVDEAIDKLRDSVGREPTLSEIAAETGLTEEIISHVLKHPVSKELLEWAKQADNEAAAPSSQDVGPDSGKADSQ